MNPYIEPDAPRRRVRHIAIAVPLRTPDPVVQPALNFDQPPAADLSIEERFAAFHASNPHIYALLRDMALAEAERGARRISTKLLFERLRAGGVATAAGRDLFQLNNIYTSRYARLLRQEPELADRIPIRSLQSA